MLHVFFKPLKIILGSFQIFSKILGDIRKSRCTTGINNIGGNFANGTAGPVANLLPEAKIPMANLPPGVNDTGGILPPVSTTPGVSLPLVSLHWDQYQTVYTLK